MANICQIGAGMIGQAMAIDLAENHNVSLGDINTVSYTHLTLPTTPYV